MLLHPFPNAFGLDIGDLSVKLVQLYSVSFLRRHPAFRVAAIREIALPPGLIVDGELQQPEEIRKYIQILLGQGKEKKFKPLHSRWVISAIPEVKAFIKLLQTPKSPKDITKKDVFEIAESHIPFGKDEYYLDAQIIPPGVGPQKEYTSLLIGATPKYISDSYTYLLESLGLGVIALEIEALSIARAMVTAQKPYTNEARAVLDIGGTRSSFIVYDHDLLQFSTTLPFYGELLTTAIEQKLGIPREDAEKKKREEGLAYQSGSVWPIMAEYVDRLAASIEQAIAFYYSHFPNPNRIMRITLSGGGASMSNLDKILTEKLGIETAPGDPWKNLNAKHTDAPAESGSGYATAIGLALRAADNPILQTTSDI